MTPVLPAPIVSVVIPTFNRAGVLARCIGSVVSQTLTEFEIIVVDDASTDGTGEAVRSMHDPRVRLIEQKTNGGAARARNAGVAAACGEFIAFLDSDDWWLPEKLATQVAAIRRAQRADRTLCSHAYHVDDQVAARTWPRRGPRRGEPLSEYMFVANGNFQTSTWMLSRSLCLAFPFEPNLRRHQDWDVLLRLASAEADFVFLTEPLGHRVCAPAPDRLSDIADAEYSRRFVEERNALFTPAATAAFGARILSWQLYKCGEQGKALALIFQAWRSGAIPLTDAAKIAVRLSVPSFHSNLVRWKSAVTGGARP